MSAQKARRKASTKHRLASKQKRALRRLEQLYAISKHLATFENVEQGFPKILSLAARAFPLTSVVLIENRGSIPKTTIWPTTGLDEAHVKKALGRARSAYSVLAGSTPSQSADLRESQATEAPLQGEEFVTQTQDSIHDKFLALPLVFGRHPIFGVLQFETSHSLDEEDLAFVDALTNLTAVALDRHYRAYDERELQKTEGEKRSMQLRESQAETKVKSMTLLRSQGRVTNLEEERALREKFVSTLSHDLRTPLTVARMSAQLIKKGSASAENLQLLAERIVSNIDRVDQMISDLLDANRVQAGEQLRLDISNCDLHAILTDTIGVLQSIHGDRFVLNAVQQQVWGYWSPDGLRRVIENLVSNAVKYGSPDDPITITLRQSEQGVRLMVHNEGDPISARDQLGLFRQFGRTSSAQTGKKAGWGLGLTLVRGVVEAHGGSVSIESAAGRGTTFAVELPNDSRSFRAGSEESAIA